MKKKIYEENYGEHMKNINIQHNDHISCFFTITAFCLGFFIPTSTFLLNVTLFLCLVCVLLKINSADFKTALKSQLVLLPIFIFSAYLLSALIVQNDYGLGITSKYRKLLYPIILVPFFLHNKNQINYFFKGFLVANIFIAILNIFSFSFTKLTGMPFPVPMNIFKEYLTLGFFLVIAAFIFIVKADATAEKKDKYIYWFIATLCCFNVLFILQGRTGVLALLVALFVYLLLNAKVKNIALALAFLVIASFVMLTTQNPIMTRTVEGINEIRQYIALSEKLVPNDEETVLDHTSMGFRMGAYNKAIEMIKEAPVFGHGAGSYLYKNEHRKPHNEYLLITVQFGFAGLLIFFFWLYKAYAAAWKQAPLWRNIFFIIISSCLAGAFFNNFLLNFSEGIFFMIIISALVVMKAQNEKDQQL